MTEQTTIARAVAALNYDDGAGGVTRLANAIGKTRDAVWQVWTGRRPLPADWCEMIERASGIRCEELRPDLDWIRDQAGRPFYAPRVSQPASQHVLRDGTSTSLDAGSHDADGESAAISGTCRG